MTRRSPFYCNRCAAWAYEPHVCAPKDSEHKATSTSVSEADALVQELAELRQRMKVIKARLIELEAGP